MRISGLVTAAVIASASLALSPYAEAGTPGKDGAKTVAAANTVVNCYTALAANAAVGATSITVASAAALTCNGLATMGAGDVVLVMQTQGASIDTTDTNSYGDITNYNSAGRYEFAVVGSVTGNVIAFTGCGAGATTVTPLANAYTASANGASTQVIRVPQYSTLAVNSPGSIVSPAWNGTIGGVVAMQVDSTATLNAPGSIDVSGRGFRGGLHTTSTDPQLVYAGYRSSDQNEGGLKGESIVGDSTWYQSINGAYGRGAPGNGGGGGDNHNAGGGGGANGDNGGAWTGAGVKLPASVAWALAPEASDTASVSGGGRGGYSYSNSNQDELTLGPGFAAWGANLRRQVGGRGGRPVANDAASRLFMGGGGGAAHRNDCTSGANGGIGGGIVLLLANTVAGAGSILANGGAAPGPACNTDGAGGGGGGGSIVVSAATSGGITLSAVGGVGGNNVPGGASALSFGPGGGGGGGYIAVSGGLGPGNVAGAAQGTDNGQSVVNFTQNGATQGASGKTDVVASVPGGCFIATRANFEGLRRDAAGTIEFAVSDLDATLGFRVHGMAEKTSSRQLISDGLLKVTSEQRASDGPQYFSVPTRFDPKFLVIEEVELSGASRWLGPFRSNDADNRRNFDRSFEKRWTRQLAVPPAAQSVPRRGLRRVPAPIGSASGVKIETNGVGYVTISVSDLIAGGMGATNPASWKLYNKGAAVTVSVVSGPAIRFYATQFESDYTTNNTYVLWQGTGAPPAPVVATPLSGPPTPDGYVRIEQNNFYVPFNPPSADPWIWTFGTSVSASVPFDLPGYVPSSGGRKIAVRLTGGSKHTHQVNLVLNGRTLGTATLAGRVSGQLSVNVPGNVLRTAGNELSFTDAASGPDPDSALVFLDRIDLEVTLPTAGANVVRIASYDASLGLSGPIDYLVLSPGAFLDAARRLADGRRGTVATTAALDVERAYDAYSAGIVEPNAIKRALRNLRNANGLKYVVLLGTDTTDPRNFQGQRPDDFIPSLMSYDDNYGRVPSEYLYSDVNGTGIPTLAVGRLPARSAEQADALVTKALDASRLLTGGGNRHVVVMDNSGAGENYSFEAEGKVQSDAFPAGAEKTLVRIADGAAEARQRLANELATGAQTLNFFGHGSLTYWADEQVMNADVASQLAGSDKGFVAFAWNCQSNLYDFNEPSLGETLLGVDDGGAVASLGPVGNTNPDFHHAFAQETYKQFLAGVPLGEAVRRARAELAPGTFKHVLNGWALLGDPLIRVAPSH